jgi:hypothetical protein
MNLGEFIFVFCTVFGSTGLILAWQYTMYKIDVKEKENERTMDILS